MAPSTLLRDPDWPWWPAALLDGVAVGVATVALTLVLELLSASTVAAIRRKPGGRALYARALRANVVNNLVIGPPVYCAGCPRRGNLLLL